jgi:hypothetical protein
MDATSVEKGDWVLSKRKDCEKRRFALIADGSFQVTKVGTDAVTLRLPPNSRAHPMVNISRVQLYFGLRPQLVMAPPMKRNVNAVDRIMGYRKRNGKEYYCIHWKGYPVEDDFSWEPRENLNEAEVMGTAESENRRAAKHDDSLAEAATRGTGYADQCQSSQ